MTQHNADVSGAVGQAAPQAERALVAAERFNDAVRQRLSVHVEKIAELPTSNGRLQGK